MTFYSKLFEMLPESESVFSVVLTSSMLATAFAPRDCIKLLDMSYKTNHERICDIFIRIFDQVTKTCSIQIIKD